MYVKIKSSGGVLLGSLSVVSKPNFARKFSLELAILVGISYLFEKKIEKRDMGRDGKLLTRSIRFICVL